MANKNKVFISNYQNKGLYFSAGIASSNNKIIKISLPKSDKKQANTEITNYYPNFEFSEEYENITKNLSKIYEGKKNNLELDMLELSIDKSNKELPVKSIFMRDVLLETYKIPSGKVETYKSLAEKLGTRAYRAVGTALAKNPFPLIIPCHRVVKSDLTIGKYGGGSEMKREILENEGVRIEGDKIINLTN